MKIAANQASIELKTKLISSGSVIGKTKNIVQIIFYIKIQQKAIVFLTSSQTQDNFC